MRFSREQHRGFRRGSEWRGMIRSTAVISLLTVPLLLSSCVVPWPNRRTEREGASGEVVDAATNQPIANASVKVSYAEGQVQEERRTSSRGRYKVAPQKGPWAWGYFIGPISGPVFGIVPDLGARMSLRVDGLEVSAEGYRLSRWRRGGARDGSDPPSRISLERQRGRSGSS